jgi:1-aminocyclopropane-1-carboxylate deaminase/D-cysteine desulfhydrase-like pyridoxal-dependent ACC family enzyme
MAIVPSLIEQLHHPILDEKQIELYVKREDLIHSEIMGNKWRKLKYNLEEAKTKNADSIVTLGGAFSNHIYALAAAGNIFDIKTVGIIRGEELTANSNATLQFAASKGMELRFVERSTYTSYRQNPEKLGIDYPNSYLLPEGGTNKLAVDGCKELVQEITIPFDVIALPIGTGGTFCGVLDGVNESQTVLGISSLKGNFIKEDIQHLMTNFRINKSNYQIETNYHFGGYGKIKPELIDFINWFKEIFNIPLDPIYTGKCFFAVWDMINSGKFEKNIKIILLHTGGLQGISGFNRKKRIII